MLDKPEWPRRTTKNTPAQVTVQRKRSLAMKANLSNRRVIRYLDIWTPLIYRLVLAYSLPFFLNTPPKSPNLNLDPDSFLLVGLLGLGGSNAFCDEVDVFNRYMLFGVECSPSLLLTPSRLVLVPSRGVIPVPLGPTVFDMSARSDDRRKL